MVYKILTLGSNNISPASLRIDDKVGYVVTVIGIPSAFLLHGYVGFIFGSVKANPWWSTPLMPIVFLFSAMVSGIAAVMLLYMASMKVKKTTIDMRCVDTIAKYLFYTFVIDFTLEMLDLDLTAPTKPTNRSAASISWCTPGCCSRRSSCRSWSGGRADCAARLVQQFSDAVRKRMYVLPAC